MPLDAYRQLSEKLQVMESPSTCSQELFVAARCIGQEPIQPTRTSINALKPFSFTTSLESRWKSVYEQRSDIKSQSLHRRHPVHAFSLFARVRILETTELAQPTNRERFHFQFLLAKQLDTPAIAITTAISFAFASQTEALDGVFATTSKSIDGGESLP